MFDYLYYVCCQTFIMSAARLCGETKAQKFINPLRHVKECGTDTRTNGNGFQSAMLGAAMMAAR